ncbi:MAG: peptide-methionine (R)-S-oxide reductase MsrB [Dokdonia sp.]|jgi:peptide-methionine (R)-S-oxide reductase|nr:peptide-methionine (R)-S-oxide reductase [Cytophagaceae bacterium]
MLKKMSFILLLTLFVGCQGEAQEQKKEAFAVQKTTAQWKATLTPDQFYILREEGTERPFTSDLLAIKKPGTFKCAGCGTPLFKTKHKFDSGTGWPSFDRAIEGNVAYSTDNKLGYTRVEEHCATCGGHLGHVFDDGPRATTGKRHCINGDALVFEPANQ